MSYGNLINETMKISARYWWLWLFGFFISLADAGGSLPQLAKHFQVRDCNYSSPDWWQAIALGLLVLGLFAGLVYLVLKIFAECSLMVAVKDIKAGGRGSIAQSFRDGLPFFLRILVLWLMIFVLAVVTTVAFGALIVLSFIAAPLLGVMVLLLLSPIWLVIIFAAEVVAAWAYRAVVIDGQGVFEAISTAWQLFRIKPGPAIVVGLIAIGSQIAFAVVGLMIYGIVGIPFIMAGLINLWLGLIPGLLIGFCLLFVIEGFTGTYASTLWTLAYLELRGNQTAQVS